MTDPDLWVTDVLKGRPFCDLARLRLLLASLQDLANHCPLAWPWQEAPDPC